MLGLLEFSVKAHRRAVTSLCFDDRGVLYTGDTRGWLACWDEFGCSWRLQAGKRSITALSTGRNGEVRAGCFDGSIVALTGNPANSRRLDRFRRGVASLCYDAERTRTIATGFDGTIAIADEGPFFLRDKRDVAGPVFARLSRDEAALLTWGSGNRIEIRSPANLEVVHTTTIPSLLVHDLLPAHGGLVFTLDYDSRLTMWLADGWVKLSSMEVRLEGQGRIVGQRDHVLWLRDSRHLVAVDLKSMMHLRDLSIPRVSAAALDPSRRRMALGFRSGEVQIWTLGDSAVTKN